MQNKRGTSSEDAPSFVSCVPEQFCLGRLTKPSACDRDYGAAFPAGFVFIVSIKGGLAKQSRDFEFSPVLS